VAADNLGRYDYLLFLLEEVKIIMLMSDDALHIAARDGDMAAVKKYIDYGLKLDKLDSTYGKLPIDFAVQNGHIEVFKYLYELHRQKNIPLYVNGQKLNLMHYAFLCQDIKKRNELIAFIKKEKIYSQLNPDITEVQEFAFLGQYQALEKAFAEANATPSLLDLTYAVAGGNKDCIEIILRKKFNLSTAAKIPNNLLEEEFLKAISDSNLILIIYFVEQCEIDPNKVIQAEKSHFTGCPPIFIASAKGDLATVKLFVEILKCNPNKCLNDPDCLNPLHIACKYGCLNLVKYYIETCKMNPFDPITKGDSAGLNAMHIAAAFGRTEIVDYLAKTAREKNVDVDPPSTTTGITALFIAISNDQLEVVKYFIDTLKVELSKKITSKWGDVTPLYTACTYGELR
jgi:ankyrin repeat protein